jgi:hypothetical protein
MYGYGLGGGNGTNFCNHSISRLSDDPGLEW